MKKTAYLRFKYIFEPLLFTILAIIFSPILLFLFLLIGIIIKIDSPGKIIYSQKRIGLNGKHFNIYKFRTMKQDSNDLDNYFSKKELEKYEKNFKLDNDPRVTKVGRILRKYSIDEFPQILNVIKGDMSIIGPRPIVDKEIEKYGKLKNKFLSVKPGLSGYWTCHCTKKTTYKMRMKMELYYVDNVSLKLDFTIFFDTVKMLFKRLLEVKNGKEKRKEEKLNN